MSLEFLLINRGLDAGYAALERKNNLQAVSATSQESSATNILLGSDPNALKSEVSWVNGMIPGEIPKTSLPAFKK